MGCLAQPKGSDLFSPSSQDFFEQVKEKIHGSVEKDLKPAPQDAILLLEQRLKTRDREDPDVLFLLGYAYYSARNFPYAEIYFQTLARQEDFVLRDYAQYFLMRSQAEQKKYLEAIGAAGDLIQHHSDSLFWDESHLDRIGFLYENHQYHDALNAISQIRHYRSPFGHPRRDRMKRIFRREKVTLSWYELKIQMQLLKNDSSATQNILKKFLTAHCDEDLLGDTLSLFYQHTGQSLPDQSFDTEPLADNLKLQDLSPLAEHFSDCRLNPQALSLLLKLQRLLGQETWNPQRQFDLGRNFYQIREYEKALDIFSQILNRFDEGKIRQQPALYSQALFWKAETLSRLDHFPEASLAYREFQKRFPRDSKTNDIYFRLGLTEYYQKNFPQARRAFSEFTQRIPRSKLYAQAAWLSGFSAFREKDFALAVDIWEPQAAKKHRAKDATTRSQYWLGRAYQELQNIESASTAFQNLYEKHPFSYYGLAAFSQLQNLARLRSQPNPVFIRPFPITSNPSFQEFSTTDLENNEGNVAIKENIHFKRAAKLRMLGFNSFAGEELTSIPRGKNRLSTLYLARLLEETKTYQRSAYIGRIYFHDDLVKPLNPNADVQDLAFRKTVWSLAYPRPFASEVASVSQREKINAHAIWALMRQESSFNPRALSTASAAGLMQVLPKTASAVLGRPVTKNELFSPQFNINVGSIYFRSLLERYQYRFHLAVAAYNAGPERVDQWLKLSENVPTDIFIEEIPFRETRNYTKRVSRIFLNLENLYRPENGGMDILNIPADKLQVVGK